MLHMSQNDSGGDSTHAEDIILIGKVPKERSGIAFNLVIFSLCPRLELAEVLVVVFPVNLGDLSMSAFLFCEATHRYIEVSNVIRCHFFRHAPICRGRCHATGQRVLFRQCRIGKVGILVKVLWRINIRYLCVCRLTKINSNGLGSAGSCFNSISVKKDRALRSGEDVI